MCQVLNFVKISLYYNPFKTMSVVLQSGPFISHPSIFLGSCWLYQKTKTTLLYQTDHFASIKP